MICPKCPSLRRLIPLCRVLSDRRCRSAATVPTTALGLSRGCWGAAGCAKEARIPVSMVTSPLEQPLFNAIALLAGRERRWRGGRSISEEEPGKNPSWCVTSGALTVVLEDGNRRGLVAAGQALEGAGILQANSLLRAMQLAETRQRQGADRLSAFGVPVEERHSAQHSYPGVILLQAKITISGFVGKGQGR